MARLGCFAVFALALVCCAYGWGQEGHEAIAEVAALRLTAATSKWVQHYLNGETLENIAPFPDDYDHTPQGKWSAPLHYCNLPRSATQFEMAYCPIPPSCVVAAISNYTNILTKDGEDGHVCDYKTGEEPCPLEFLVHFVGDVHQPLHVAYAYDEGGNDVNVDFFGEYTELHAVWDDKIIEKYQRETNRLVDDMKDMITQEPGLVEQYAKVKDPALWANESFSYVLSTVYNFTESERISKKEIYLGEAYYTRNLPIIEQRLIAAAVRLADLLNDMFDNAVLANPKLLAFADEKYNRR